MSLWDWAGKAWAKPGVGAACLVLQDDHGQCVPLLLWAIWRAERGGIDDAMADRAVALCRAADTKVIAPLRAARRRAASPERERLLADELAAEHDLLDSLEALSGRGRHPPACDLADLSKRWGRPLDPAVFEPLIRALRAREAADVR